MLEHTGSYYAATVNDVTDFSPLRGDQSADVCVIGAGFTGVATALNLVERGYNVHVVEANRVGWGASGRNGGQIISGISGERRIAKKLDQDVEDVFGELRWAGHDIIRQRVEQYGIECDLKFGYLGVAIKGRHVRDLEADFERLQKANFPYKINLLDGNETSELIGTDAYVGALLNMANGHLHPLNLCIGEARAAESLGACIYEQSPVLDIIKGDKAKVVTQHGSVTADTVVIAGNAYHELDRKLRGMMFPVNSFIIATEPLTEELVQSINPQDLAVCDPNFAVQYFRLSADKRMLFGGRCDYFGDDPEVIKKMQYPKLLKIYPQLAGTSIDYTWSGTIGVTINRVPQLGRVSPNIFYCQGYSGHGVNVTHIAGQIMADAIAGTMERFDVFANVKPLVIPGMRLLHKPMVSLGMMYYRLRDQL